MNRECMEFTTQLKALEACRSLYKFAHVGKFVVLMGGGEDIFEPIKLDDHVLPVDCRIQ